MARLQFVILASILVVLETVFVALEARAEDRPHIDILSNLPHNSAIRTVAFSTDGAHAASGGDDNRVKIWDIATGRLVRTLEEPSAHRKMFQATSQRTTIHFNNLSSVAFSPDRSHVLAGGSNGLWLWDAATGKLRRTFQEKEAVLSLAFSPDGSQIVSGGWGNTLTLWNPASGRVNRTLDGSGYAVAFSPDGSQALSGGSDETLKLWEAASGRLIRRLDGRTPGTIRSVKSIAFSPNGAAVLSSDWISLRLWDVATGRLLNEFGSAAVSVAFSPDSSQIASAEVGRDVTVWDAKSGEPVRRLRGPLDSAMSVAFAPDGRHVLVGGIDSMLRLWDVPTAKIVRMFAAQNLDAVSSPKSSPDGNQLVAGGSAIKLWDAATGRLRSTISGLTDRIWTVAFSPDGTHLLSGSKDKTVKLWDAATGALLRTLGTDTDEVSEVVFSPDGLRIAAANGTRSVRIWEARNGELRQSFEGPALVGGSFELHASSIAFAPHGTTVALGSGDGPISLWDSVTGRLLRTMEGHTWSTLSVAFSLDGSRVLSGGGDDTLKLWDVPTGRLLHAFEGHLDNVTSVALSPDDTRALSASDDGTVKLWVVPTGKLVRSFEIYGVNSVAFSPDGTRAITGSRDRTVKILDLESGRVLIILVGAGNGEWMAMTPAGFFAASRNGSEMLSIMRGFQVTAIDQVWQSLFNPDLVRGSLAGDPDGEVKRAAELINLDKVMDSGPAPLVEITSYPVSSESAKDVVTVRARITDRDKGIGRIEWRVNGVTAAVGTKPPGVGPIYYASQQLALDPGDSTIEVVAYNGSNLLASLPAQTTIKFIGSVDHVKPNLHVLSIGINKYVDQGWTPPGSLEPVLFPPLTLAVKDATSVAHDLKAAAVGQYEGVEVALALDENATRDKLERIIDKLAGEIQPRDTFIFFAAGHGISNDGRFYLIPQDYTGGTNPAALKRNAISQEQLQDWFARIKAKKALILLDTCQSGALIAGHLKSRTDSAASEAGVGRLHEATGRPVLTAAALGQDAWEGRIAQSGERHGVFTWALLDGLRNADTNNNETIELSELVAHVQNLVPKAEIKEFLVTKSLAGVQSARFGSRGEDFTLVRRLR